MGNSDLVDISGEIKGETEKAYRFFDGDITEWILKSQCEWDESERTMTMPGMASNGEGIYIICAL